MKGLGLLSFLRFTSMLHGVTPFGESKKAGGRKGEKDKATKKRRRRNKIATFSRRRNR